MAESKNWLQVEPSGFCVLRTPLLPYDQIEAWSSGLTAAAAWRDAERLEAALAADRRMLRERLGEIYGRPEIVEALFLASPDLCRGLESWRRDPDSKKGRRAEEALVRYFQRMAGRSTPFGLFSGCTIGRVHTDDMEDGVEDDAPDGAVSDSAVSDSAMHLEPLDTYRRFTRLDCDYLFNLTESLGRDPATRRQLRYQPNSSLYLSGGRWRYCEARVQGFARVYHLVAVDRDEFLETALRRALPPATLEELAQAVAESDPDGEILVEEALEFIDELIDSQILVSDLTPPVTGKEPLDDLHDQLAQLEPGDEAEKVRTALAEVRESLGALDGEGLGAPTETYHAVERRLEPLPAPVNLSRLFQVDMMKPAANVFLGPEIVAEIRRGVEVLHHILEPGHLEQYGDFCRRFRERYGARAVPLIEVLDEESGIGFGASSASVASPLLDGLAMPTPSGTSSLPWTEKNPYFMKLIEESMIENKKAVEVRLDEIRALPAPLKLPDAFQVMTRIAAASPEALARGDFTIVIENYDGPAGVRLLGRFCHLDPELDQHVQAHLRREEALQPEAIFAEVVHLPMGRAGNVVCRPTLRPHEIQFLGRGGAEEKHRIPVTDLRVAVRDDTIELYSSRLGRRVVPCLATAHNTRLQALTIYSFICSLQYQGHIAGAWQWGHLDQLSFTPRITCGRVVLMPARWRFSHDQVKKISKGRASERFRAVQELRERRDLPRHVLLLDDDKQLPVDFDNVLSVETFLASIKGRQRFVLGESFQTSGQLCVEGPEGRFVNEVIVPFHRRRQPDPPAATLPQPIVDSRRFFAPASEWLFLKIYCGDATGDRVLTEVIGPIARQMMASGTIDRWHFLRFSDPEGHIRARFHGQPARLLAEVLPRAEAALSPLLDNGLVSSLQLDTYQREIERYGGRHGIELSEQFFAADSEAVLALVELLGDDAGAAGRWQAAFRGSYQLVTDFAEDPSQTLEILHTMQRRFAARFGADRSFKKQLADRLRRERRRLSRLLGPELPADDPLAPAAEVLDRRTRDIAPLVSKLREHEQAGRLTVPLREIVTSYVHMFINRLLRSDGPSHELVLYDFLYRTVRSEQARRRQAAQARLRQTASKAAK